MTGEQQFTSDEQQILTLAGEALSFGIAGRHTRAAAVIQRISDTYGAEGVDLALLAWCDQLILQRPGGDDGRPVRVGFVDADDGTVADADGVPAEVAWAGRMIAARAAGDEGMWSALVASLPFDGEAVSRHVSALFQMVALNLRSLAQARRRGAS